MGWPARRRRPHSRCGLEARAPPSSAYVGRVGVDASSGLTTRWWVARMPPRTEPASAGCKRQAMRLQAAASQSVGGAAASSRHRRRHVLRRNQPTRMASSIAARWVMAPARYTRRGALVLPPSPPTSPVWYGFTHPIHATLEHTVCQGTGHVSPAGETELLAPLP
jgi:hypothetical protein